MYTSNFIVAILALGALVLGVPLEKRQGATSIAAAPFSIALPSLVPPSAMLGPYSLKSITPSSTSVSTQVPSITDLGEQPSALAAIAPNSAPSAPSAPAAAKAKSDVVGRLISKFLTALHGLLRF